MEKMFYHSTNLRSPKVDFKEATINGLAPDKGLYFPERIPALAKKFIHNLNAYTKEEISHTVMSPYVGGAIPENELQRILSETINFDFPLVDLNTNISALELFHGPTLAFKDVGARFMSRCLSYFVRDGNQKVTVLVATSGDTGGAVANGFYNVAGVDVVILYPQGKVSSIQESQLTTLGKNIYALEVDGTFDDCQHMVKQAFADDDLQKALFITSANSINIARWLPQQLYYFFALKQWKEAIPPVISVPSGNLGNLSAGLLAFKSGLPVKHFIAACNANDAMPTYLSSGKYIPKKSISTISNAMDVGDPSNFVRIKKMFEGEGIMLGEILSGSSISDSETIASIKKVHDQTGYLLDPHGAVAYTALEKYVSLNRHLKGIFLETAHPAKFYNVIEPQIGHTIDIPGSVLELMKMKKQSIKIGTDFSSLKDFLISR